jgi:hypothetical protein
MQAVAEAVEKLNFTLASASAAVFTVILKLKYGLRRIPADAPHGTWMTEVPDAKASPLKEGRLTVCKTQGIGLAERLERKLSGIESIEAGRI